MIMRLITGGPDCRQAKNAGASRQLLGAALLSVALLLTGCGQTEASKEPAIPGVLDAQGSGRRSGIGSAFRGGPNFAAVSADESRAAEVGRDILLAGGNATDAAVAMYFALAVTLPASASLDAAGVCIVHDSKTKAGEAFAFPPTPAPGPINGVAFNIPVGVRAVALMNIRHGSMRWEQLVAPAERLARFGVPVSRALARDLQSGASLLGSDREARRIFGKGTGTAVTEGDTWTQSDLAGTLGTIRQYGGGEFFQGRSARLFSDQIAQLGGSLPLEALRNAVPQAGPPAGDKYSGHRVYVAQPPMGGANAMAGWNGEPAPATGSANAGGVAGFVAVDQNGGAVACNVSMGQLFGARIIVPGTGILLATPSPEAAAISPMVIGNPGNGEFVYAGAAGGTSGAAYAAGAIARVTVRDGQPLGQALAARASQGGWVNAIVCAGGIRGGGGTCQAATDQASGGLALLANPR
jgi:gamma-glutamyltranspeptidase / glutathione hydrolase